MLVQMVCVAAGEGFLTLLWPGERGDPPKEGLVRLFHANIMELFDERVLDDPECLRVSGSATYWQAQFRDHLKPPTPILPFRRKSET
ncbi:MAG: hypothetical protein M0Z41_14850 [Peptococcaceae bacterium]|jgi:hypothetical protein|nr:hypothetical protein [Peptococcaceae bacterium]